jgi:DNA mismatch repair protein MutS
MHHLAHIIDETDTTLGSIFLCYMLLQPTTDTTVLQRTQACIKALIEDEALLEELDLLLKKFKKSESMLLSFWPQDPLKNAAQRKYFNYGASVSALLNKSKKIMTTSAVLEHQKRFVTAASTMIAAALLPLYGATHAAGASLPATMEKVSENLRNTGGPIFGLLQSCTDNNYALTFLAIASGITCGFMVKDTVDWMLDNFFLERCIHKKMVHTARAIAAAKKITKIIESKEQIHALIPLKTALATLSSSTSSDLSTLLKNLDASTFKHKSSFLTPMGTTLTSFKLFCSLKHEFEDLFICIGQLDAYVSLAKLYKEHEHTSTPYCFVDFTDTEKPSLHLEDFWNPFVLSNNVILNTVTLGTAGHLPDLLITGPNAGGKSTLLKAIAINIIMAQSFGIAPSRHATLTPFHRIMTYLNIVDDISSGNSLFNAQALRVLAILQSVTAISADQRCFIIVDEMFNGTSPEEAAACSFAVAKALGTYSKTISILATHYPLLTTLEQKTNAYENFCVGIMRDADDKLHYPFTLKRGISRDFIALDILKARGFDESIIADARAILYGDDR